MGSEGAGRRGRRLGGKGGCRAAGLVGRVFRRGVGVGRWNGLVGVSGGVVAMAT